MKRVLFSILLIALTIPVTAFGARPEAVANEYFIGFKTAITASDVSMLKANGATMRDQFAGQRAAQVVIRNAAQATALSRHPRVEYVEQVPMRYKLGLAEAELAPTATNGLYGLVTTKSTDVHARGVSGAGIKVGVADTSIDSQHPDIAANLDATGNCVGGTSANPCPGSGDFRGLDTETHATHVAGTILAVKQASPGTGVYGVAYSARLAHARVLGPSGGSSADIMRGVRWLVEKNGCKIINLSLGGGLKSRTEENFYKEMRDKGVLVVAATGNDGKTTKTGVSYPAAYAVNIAVGAVDKNNAIASFSNQGSAIDVVAPGVSVLSAVPDNMGSEAGVNSNTAFGLEFAGKTTADITKSIFFCGLGGAGEFPAEVAGNIALIQRGTHDFSTKVTNAMNAGAVAAVIYNNAAGDFIGTLGAATTADGRDWIPAVSLSKEAGEVITSGSTATVFNKVSDWDYMDGTSMATPHAAGVVALIWSANPALAHTTVESHLFTTCTDLGAAGFDITFGRGIVNASAAVAKAGK